LTEIFFRPFPPAEIRRVTPMAVFRNE